MKIPFSPAKILSTFILLAFGEFIFSPARAMAAKENTPILTQTTESDSTTYIRIGQAVHLLTGPWRFRPGDNKHWADPGFDDSRWETINLTPARGAHDSDVGLTNYVPGWWARGHPGYTGYAWYRLHITVDNPAGIRIALLAPPYVEDAYQIFWNGKLIGKSGDFSGKIPVIYSTKPQVLYLPHEIMHTDTAIIAIRVWMRSGLARLSDAGGIHIPPAIGTKEAIHAQYQLQWLQTIKGYIVEVAEPLVFILLVILAWCFRAVISTKRFVYWLSAALLLTAAYRINQAVFYWTSFENLSLYLSVHLVLIPLGLAAWIMAWRHWYQLEHWRWLTIAIGIAALLGVILVLTLPPDVFATVKLIWRIPLAAVLLATAVIGLRKRQPDSLLAFITVLAVAVSQFSGELAALGVPYIWFPFGTGVSLTQYAYAAIIVCLSVLFIRRIQRAVMNKNIRPERQKNKAPGATG